MTSKVRKKKKLSFLRLIVTFCIISFVWGTSIWCGQTVHAQEESSDVTKDSTVIPDSEEEIKEEVKEENKELENKENDTQEVKEETQEVKEETQEVKEETQMNESEVVGKETESSKTTENETTAQEVTQTNESEVVNKETESSKTTENETTAQEVTQTNESEVVDKETQSSETTETETATPEEIQTNESEVVDKETQSSETTETEITENETTETEATETETTTSEESKINGKYIVSSEKLNDIYIGVGEYTTTTNTEEQMKKNKMPQKVTFITDTGTKIYVDVDEWVLTDGTFDGSTSGSYNYQAVYTLPEGYAFKDDKEVLVTAKVSLLYNTLYIYDDDVYIVIDNDKKGLNAKKYDTSIVKEITVDGTDGHDIFYFDLTTNFNDIKIIKIDGGKGHDCITTTLDSSQLSLRNCDVEFIAEEVIFDMQETTTWEVNSINIIAKPDKTGVIDMFIPCHDTDVTIKLSNLKLSAAKDIKIDATVDVESTLSDFSVLTDFVKSDEVKDLLKNTSNGINDVISLADSKMGSDLASKVSDLKLDEIAGAKAEELAKQGDDYVKEFADTSFLVVERNINVNIDIDNCIISGEDVLFSSSVNGGTYTVSLLLPVSINIFNIKNNININNSQIIASNGDVIISASSDLYATAAIIKWLNLTSLNMAIALNVIDCDSNITLSGDSVVKASGDVKISDSNDIKVETIANASNAVGKSEEKSGGAIALAILEQNTNVNINDTVSIISENNNVVISSDEYCQNDVKAMLSENEYSEKWEKLGKDLAAAKSSIKDILDKITTFFIGEKKVVDAGKTEKVKDTFNKTTAVATDEKQTKKISETQLVATTALSIIDGANGVTINTTGLISALNGKISILANGVSNNVILSDASVVKEKVEEPKEDTDKKETSGEQKETSEEQKETSEEQKETSEEQKETSEEQKETSDNQTENTEQKETTKKEEKETSGCGVAVAMDIINFVNKATINSNVKIQAKEFEILAITGGVIVDGKSVDTKSDVTAKSGYNVGDSGLGGAMAINVCTKETIASIDKLAVIVLDGENLTVKANDSSTASTIAETANKGEIEKEEESTGIGAAINVTNIYNKVYALINGKVTGTVNALTVEAKQTGKDTLTVNSGSSAGSSISPCVAVNVFSSDVVAYVSENVNLYVLKDATISAVGTNKNNVNASSISSGKEKGIGAVVAFAMDDFNTDATVDGVIKADGKIDIKADGDNVSNVLTSATSETKSEVKKEEDKTEENKAQENQTSENDSFSRKVTNRIYGNVTQNFAGNFAKDNAKSVTPQDPSTTEGSVDKSAILVIQLINDIVNANINNDVIANDVLNVNASSNTDADVKANATAIKGSDSVGIAVILQTINKQNHASIEANKEVTAKGITVTALEKDTDTIKTVAISGAGASDVGVAEALVVSSVVFDTKAYIDGVYIKAFDGDINIKAEQKNNYKNAALAYENVKDLPTEEEKEVDNSVGTGASFALGTIKDSVLAYIGDKAEEVAVSGSLNICSSIGGVDKDIDETKTNIGNDITIVAMAGEESKTQENNQANKALDAAVAISIVDTAVKAMTSQNTLIVVGKDITCNANTSSLVETNTYGCASASKSAAGATVALNLVYEDILALLASDVEAGGKVNVISKASTIDVSKAWATASGVKAADYAKKYSLIPADILNGKYIIEFLNGESAKKGEASGQTSTSEADVNANTTNTDNNTSTQTNSDAVQKKLVGENGTYSDKLPISSSITSNYAQTVDVNKDTSDVVDRTNITATDKDGNTSSNVNKDGKTTQAGTTSKEDSIAIAAAVACNIISHDALAIITGKVLKAASVDVQAINNNNFQSIGTGESVDDESAISAGVSVMINNSDAIARVSNDIFIADDKISDTKNDLQVKAVTTNNAIKVFECEVASFAIAGSKSGEDGELNIAGAIAVLVSNAKTIAQIQNIGEKAPCIQVQNGDVMVNAYEKNKLSAKAWAASLSSNGTNIFSDSKNVQSESSNESSSESKESATGVGAAFAILTSNSIINSFIGKDVHITANNVSVLSAKVLVDKADYVWEFDLNGNLVVARELKNIPIVGTKEVSHKIPINLTSKADDAEHIINAEDVEELLLDAIINTTNYLASSNYYVEAAGGTIDNNSKSGVKCAGSFAVLYYNDKIISNIADGVTIIFNENADSVLTVDADSNINTILISGSGAIGGSVCVGTSATVVVNNATIAANIGLDNGSKVNIIGQKGINVKSSLQGDILLIGISASIPHESDSTAVVGTIGVISGSNKVTASIDNADIDGTGNISVTANNALKSIEILGGAALSDATGVGASVGVHVINNNAIAFIGKNVTIGNEEIYAGNVDVKANSSEWILSIVTNGAASKNGVAVSASPAVLIVNTETKAILYSDKIYAGSVNVNADGDTKTIVIVGGISVAANSTAVGGAVQVDIFNKDVNAFIGQDKTLLYVKGDVNVKAISNDEIVSIVAGMSAANNVSVGGSIDVIVINNNVISNLYAGGVISKDLSVTVDENVKITSIAGDLGLAISSVGVGFANVDIIFNGKIKATIDSKDTKLDVLGDMYVNANANEDIILVAVPICVANKPAISAGVGVVVFDESVETLIKGTISAKSIKLSTKDITNIDGYIIGISASGSTGVGGCIGQITFLKDVKTLIENSSDITTTNGSLIIENNCNEKVIFFVAGASGSGKCAVNGSILNIVVNDKVKACVENGTKDNKTKLAIAGDLVIVATNLQDIRTIAGAISGSGSVAAGGAINTVIFEGSLESYLGSNTDAIVEGSSEGYTYFDGEITSKNGEVDDYNDYNGGLNKNSTKYYGILIGAVNNQIIDNWAISGMGSGSVAAGGSVIVTTCNEATTAAIMSDCNVISKKGIAIIALDETQITSQAGQLMGSGLVAVGLSSDTLYLNKKVNAYIEEGSIVKAQGGNILIIANSYEFLRSMTVGLGGSGSVSVNGSVSVVVIENDITARAGAKESSENAKETVMESYGSTLIRAEDSKELLVVSGSASGSGSVAVGAGCSVITSKQKANAYLGDNVTAEVLGIVGVTFYTGLLDSTGRKEKKILYGLLIGAFNTNDMYQIVYSASGAGAASVAASVATLVNNDITSAMINTNSRVNQGNREYSSKAIVKVVAVDTSDLDSVDAGAAGGYVGVAAAVVVTVYNKIVNAYIANGSYVYANAGIDVIAYSYNTSNIISAGVGAGAVGVAGTSNTYTVSDNVTAYISGQIVSDGYVNVTARALNDLHPISGTISAGAVGAGATVIVFTYNGKTVAYVAKDAVIKAIGNVSIVAESMENLILAAGAGGAGAVGASGAVGVIVINVTTKAYTEDGVSIKAGGDLVIKALDYSKLFTTVDNVSAGAIGAGGACDVFIYRNTVAAVIGAGNVILAGSVTVQADNNRDIKAYVIGASGGEIGVGGSVLVMLVGASTNEELYTYQEGGTVVKSNASNYLGSSGTTIDANTDAMYDKSLINVDENYQNDSINKANSYVLAAKNNGLSILSIFNSKYVEDKTISIIAQDSSVTSTKGDINVIANELNIMEYVAGAIGAGAIGVGASVAVAVFNGTVEAGVAGNIVSAQNVNVIANSKVSAKDFYTVAGILGAIGVGGAVSVITINGSVKAYQDAGNIKADNDVNIKADLQMLVTPYTLQANVGGVALGACVAVANVNGVVQSYTTKGAVISKAANVTITANGVVISSPETTALTVGLAVAGNAAVSVMNVKTVVNAISNGNISGNIGNVLITAALCMYSNVCAYGTSIAGVSGGGATVLYLTVSPTVYAGITSAVVDIKGNLEVYSVYNYKKDGEEFKETGTTTAIATASSAAIAASLSGVVMYISSSGSVESSVKSSSVSVGGSMALLSLGNFLTKVEGGQTAYSIGLGVGAIVVNIDNTASVGAYISSSSVDVTNDVIIDTKNLGNLLGNARGEGGGLIAAGTAQSINIIQMSISNAYIDGNSTVSSNKGSIIIHADNETTSNILANGFSASGFASGGITYAKLNVTKITQAYVGDNCNLYSKKLIDIQASGITKNIGSAAASSVALGAGVTDVNLYIILNNITKAFTGKNVQLKSDGDISIIANSDNDNKVDATASTGGVIAAGIVFADATMYDNTNVSIGGNSTIFAIGDVYILSNTDDDNTSNTVGGTGGVFTGNATQATGYSDIDSTIVTGNDVNIISKNADVSMYAYANVYGRYKVVMNFSVDLTSYLSSAANATSYINTTINLGDRTKISGVNVTVWSEVEKIDLDSYAWMKTVNILHTKSRPESTLNTYVNADIIGNSVNISAKEILIICALVDTDVKITTYSYGYTAGVLGSVISKTTNNTVVNANIAINNADSVLIGDNVCIKASAPRENQVSYQKEAKYEADTVTEFVSKAVETFITVVETVTEKICSWLGWFGKLIKWVNKQFL